ncbi:hypothetical protein COK98_08890 [Bacillus cereus]|uniref:Uncharacterized protein n=1 Tax=Bacillus cereus TaxID=1396 RepID=A0A9X7BDQ2_BACCE|nr:hypothetical protein CON26_25780 [Bacillus cereus]PFV08640.1 hypothetical protein COK98_08890 [Bacillus cereus]
MSIFKKDDVTRKATKQINGTRWTISELAGDDGKRLVICSFHFFIFHDWHYVNDEVVSSFL